MSKQHWSGEQLGDYPCDDFGRRASDQAADENPHPVIVVLTLIIECMAVFGVLALVGWRW